MIFQLLCGAITGERDVRTIDLSLYLLLLFFYSLSRPASVLEVCACDEGGGGVRGCLGFGVNK